MKVKVLRYKKEHNPFQEFIHIEDMGGGPEVFTSAVPKLHPETATLELMQQLMDDDDYYEGLELDWDTVELVEFDLIDSGVVGADIRNKLSPPKNLVSMLEVFFKEKDEEKKYYLKRIIKKEMTQSKKSIKYIANLL